jgi:RNA polymerase sigma factor (TIGR02999 family)
VVTRLTELLQRAQAGDERASEAVVAAAYETLRSVARARLRRAERITLLDTTALVHEWYERFSRTHGLAFEDRHHFLRHSGRIMHSIVVDHVRRRRAARRGGGDARLALGEPGADEVAVAGERQILAVHGAVEELERLEPRAAQVVELRYFAGLTEGAIAQALGISERTVRRDWEKARAWFAATLGEVP